MGDKTGIEWSDATWSPVTGCSRTSPGCDSCYAAQLAATRLRSHPRYEGLAVLAPGGPAEFTGEVRCHPDLLDAPIRWRKPRRIFVCSQSDLFHPSVPDDFIADVFATMAMSDRHTYQVLTKRAVRCAALLSDIGFVERVTWRVTGADGYVTADDITWPLPNVHLGTSIESDKYTFRADYLRRAPAATRFVSAEPLLGPLPSLNLDGIDWLIVGAESGRHARPMDEDWVRELRDQCLDAMCPECGERFPYDAALRSPCFYCEGAGAEQPTAFFYKQLVVDGRKVGLPELDGRTWDEYPVPRGAR